MRELLAGVGLVVVGAVGAVMATGAAEGQERHPPYVQAQTATTSTGRIIEANDGDTVIVRENARVRMVKRTPGRVRIAVNPARNYILVMLDKNQDGSADWAWRFETGQPYPLEAPWEGVAEIDEYFEPNRHGGGLGVVTPQGVIQFLSPAGGGENPHAAPNALAILRSGSVRAGMVSGPFAAVEPYWLEGRENEYMGVTGKPTFRFGLTMTGPPKESAKEAVKETTPPPVRQP